jgi:ABC-type spermidine/putrescine transport system permease subunit II
LLGGITGSVVGCMGALVGVLAHRGRGRRLALGFLKALLAVGAVSLALGILAVLRSQPYEVFYPLLLEGAICLGLPLFLQRVVRRRYEEIELRRISARDLGTRSLP